MLKHFKNIFSEPAERKASEPIKQITDDLNKVDLGFIIDTTGSMGSFITEAKQHLLDVLATFRDRSKRASLVAISHKL